MVTYAKQKMTLQNPVALDPVKYSAVKIIVTPVSSSNKIALLDTKLIYYKLH